MKFAAANAGGGSKGAYEAGWWYKFYQRNPHAKAKIVYGTSTGALITALIAAYEVMQDKTYLEKMVQIYSTVTDKDIMVRRYPILHKLLGEKGALIAAILRGGSWIYHFEPIKRIIDSVMTERVWWNIIEAGHKNEIDIGFSVVSLQSGNADIISNMRDPDPRSLREGLIASASQPVLMPPVYIYGQQFVDGGMIDYVPVGKIFKSKLLEEVDTIFALSLMGHQPSQSPKLEGATEILFRTLELFIDGVYPEDVKSAQLYNALLALREAIPEEDWEDYVSQLPDFLKSFVNDNLKGKTYKTIHHIEPKQPIKMDGLKFEQPAMKNLVHRGMLDADEVLRDLGY